MLRRRGACQDRRQGDRQCPGCWAVGEACDVIHGLNGSVCCVTTASIRFLFTSPKRFVRRPDGAPDDARNNRNKPYRCNNRQSLPRIVKPFERKRMKEAVVWARCVVASSLHTPTVGPLRPRSEEHTSE